MNLRILSFLNFLPLLLVLSVPLLAATVSPGSSLYASNRDQKWTSPSGSFSFGFLPLDSSGSSPSFIAAIIYSGGVPIWSAGGRGATVDASGALHFLADGNLRLINGSGAVVWESNTTGRGVSSAVLQESGNLVLQNSGSVPIWSSFDNPTDTIVPLQNFTKNMVLRSGLYSFNLLNVGNITLTWNDDVIYWNHGLNTSISGTLNSPSLELQPIGMLAVFDTKIPAGSFVAYSSDYADGTDTLRFLRLDSDGSLGIYSTVRGSGNEALTWVAIPDKCQIFGFCGELGICRYNDTSPVCGCPSENFEPVDPNDLKKGCKRKMGLENCSDGITMLELEHTKFLIYPNKTQIFSMQISGCQSNCRQGSPCVASTALSDGSGSCYYTPPGYIRGYQSATLPSTAYIKVCGPALPNQLESPTVPKHRKDWKVTAWVVVLVVLVTLFAMVAFEAGLWWWCCRNSSTIGGMSTQYTLLEYASGAPVQFSYKELDHVTKGFKEKLGSGGFGAVYKGILTNRTVVAVKQLEGIEQGEKQFRMEVATISSTHHVNLLRLIGFCSQGRHRLLVYEFMKNGSLDLFLFKTEEHSGKFLNWENRFNIALGTAKGITYLHEECRDCIVHCDIKPENILLDENFNAKVSDFGLAKLINIKDPKYRTLTSVRGTRGYMAPEWLANLPLTSKSDVFSYGMVLLEIVSGRRNFEVSAETNHKRFSMWAYEEFEKGNLMEIVDKRLIDQQIDMEQLSRVLQVSFWCIQEQPSQRPMMGKVMQMLEGLTEIEKPPAPKVLSIVSASGTSTYVSSNVSAFSTTDLTPAPSSVSSSHAAGDLSSACGTNLEKSSSSLLRLRHD